LASLSFSGFQWIGNMIIEVLDGLVAKGDVGNAAIEATVKERALELCEPFPFLGE
jgi:glycine hydroxymethyltransferase